MVETFTITAGSFTETWSNAVSATDWVEAVDWGVAEPRRVTSEGVDGARPLDPAEYGNRTITLRVQRNATGGEADSRVWLEALQRLAAEASRRDDATLVRTHASSSALTAEIVTMRVEPIDQLGMLWSLGRAQASIVIEALPCLLGAWETLSGTLVSTSGVATWTGSSTVKGDVPALAKVTGTWTGDLRREARAWAGSVAPTVIGCSSMTKDIAAWATATGVTGSMRTTVISGAVYPTGQPVGMLNHAPGVSAGDYFMDVRCRCDTTGTLSQLVVMVDGSETNRVYVQPGTGATGWRTVNVGRVTLTASSRIYLLAVGSTGATQTWTMDYVVLHPAERSKAANLENPAPRRAIINAGDIAASSGMSNGATLNGRTGNLGGTWTATGWTYDSTRSAFRATTSGVATLSSTATLPVLASWAPIESTSGTSLVSGNTFVFKLTNGAKALTVTLSASAGLSPGSVSVTDGTTTWSATVSGWVNSQNIVPSVDMSIRTDGTISVVVTSPIDTKTTISAKSAALTGTGTWSASVNSGGSPVAAITIASLVISQAYDYPATLEWSDTSAARAAGDLPRLSPGVTPIVTMRGGVTSADVPTSQTPSSVVVEARPRWLQVRGD